ncbi:MAG: hypothetical protein ACXVC1_03290 [Tumebacillaceae bacterium]
MGDAMSDIKPDQEALQKLFAMQPDNRLTPAQMVRRSLFPRWEIIRPAPYDPVAEEDRILHEILDDHVNQSELDQNPGR